MRIIVNEHQLTEKFLLLTFLCSSHIVDYSFHPKLSVLLYIPNVYVCCNCQQIMERGSCWLDLSTMSFRKGTVECKELIIDRRTRYRMNAWPLRAREVIWIIWVIVSLCWRGNELACTIQRRVIHYFSSNVIQSRSNVRIVLHDRVS